MITNQITTFKILINFSWKYVDTKFHIKTYADVLTHQRNATFEKKNN